MAKKLTEKELLETQQMALIQLDLSSSKRGEDIEALGDMMPCAFHFNSQEDLTLQYMNQGGLDFFNLASEEEAKEKASSMDFLKKHMHPESIKLGPKLLEFYQKSDGSDSLSNFQQIRINEQSEFRWLFSSTKVYRKKNTLVTISTLVNDLDEIGHKLSRVLDENTFMKANFRKFAALTAREREIITLLALGFNNPQISEKLFIARSTVEQHRKNINRKLEIENYAQLLKFALAFDLV